jgi:hypothetical protein
VTLPSRDLGVPASQRFRGSFGRVATAAFVIAALGTTSCETDPGVHDYASSSRAPFVVFLRTEMVVDTLGVRVAPPIAVGSTFFPATVTIDAPRVVSIQEDGSLVAHAEGTAIIRSRSNPADALRVDVRLPVALRLEPPELELAPGDEVELRLFAGDRALPSRSVQWLSSDAGVVLVREGRVETGRPGTATVTAVYAGESSKAMVVVAESKPDPTFVIRPPRIRARVGELVAVEAERRGLPVLAAWDVKPSGVLRVSGPSTLVAVRAGSGELCAFTGGQRRCVPFTVR